MDMLYQIYKSDGVLLEKKFNIDPSATFFVDRGKIQQVLVNLINNARDCLEGRANARIVVSTRIEASKLIITIEDNGAGIPKELHDKIFDPFLRPRKSIRGQV